jgi:enamine deaminase RidA (YjgF/YER057c/UK114 family)
LRELGIELPPPPQPVAVYVPVVRTGNLVFTSGHGPSHPDGSRVEGKVGHDLTVEQGHAAARLVGLNVLSSVRNALGSLDQVARLVKVLGMVNCPPNFTQQPQVINGFSELMVQVFGETAGKGARSAVGMSSLPGNIAVEIEAVFEAVV